jgi:hypothetical protein
MIDEETCLSSADVRQIQDFLYWTLENGKLAFDLQFPQGLIP